MGVALDLINRAMPSHGPAPMASSRYVHYWRNADIQTVAPHFALGATRICRAPLPLIQPHEMRQGTLLSLWERKGLKAYLTACQFGQGANRRPHLRTIILHCSINC